MSVDYLGPAVEAVQDLYDEDHPGRPYELSRTAMEKVTAAVRYGDIHPAQIALEAKLPQLLVAKLIDHPQERMNALRTARQHADQYRQQVMEAMRTEAQRMRRHGVDKVDIVQALGVTRTTVDRWVEQPTVEQADAWPPPQQRPA